MQDKWTEAQHMKMRAAILKAANRGSNPVAAAGIMFHALDAVWDSPAPLREALVDNFTGRLLDQLLKAVGESPSTDEEQRA
jgi:hypothetical protein